MNQVTTVNETTMPSLDFLTSYVNPARLEAGENEIRNNDFNKKIIDECDDLITYEKIVRGNTVKYFELTHDQMLLIGMRESKAVRKSVLAKLKELEKPKVLSPMEMIAAMALNSVKQEKALLQLESQVTTIGSDMQSIKTKVDKIQDLSDQLEFGYVTLKEGYFKYCNVCTYDVFREFANITGLPTKPFNHVPEGTVVIVKTVQVKISDLDKLRNYIVAGAQQVSKTLWTHTDLNHRFLLKI